MLTAIRCGKLLVGSGDPPLHRALVLFDGDRILAVGTQAQLLIGPDGPQPSGWTSQEREAGAVDLVCPDPQGSVHLPLLTPRTASRHRA